MHVSLTSDECDGVQSIAKDSGITDLSVFICRFDMPAQDIHCGRVPPPPPHLETVLKVYSHILHSAHLASVPPIAQLHLQTALQIRRHMLQARSFCCYVTGLCRSGRIMETSLFQDNKLQIRHTVETSVLAAHAGGQTTSGSRSSLHC